ncbi:MAG: cupin domain-containing protein [bacterium]|nr:cupin domain-containing protein [bacterium]
MAETSEVAKELKAAIERRRGVLGHRHDAAVANALGVGAPTLSKWMNNLASVPDEERISRVAEYAGMSDEDFDLLLARAARERAARIKDEQHRKRVVARWRKINKLVGLPRSFDGLLDHEGVVLEALEAAGVDTERQEVAHLVQSTLKQRDIPSIEFRSLVSLLKHAHTGEGVPNLEQFCAELYWRMQASHRRLVPGADGLLRKTYEHFTDWSLPLSPGVVLHLIHLEPGQQIPPHSEPGVEAVLLLEGQITFCVGGRTFDLDASERDLLLYDSSTTHSCEARTKTSGITIHYFTEKWEVYLRHYCEQLRGQRTESVAPTQEGE